MVSNNGIVIRSTCLQLVEVNKNTVKQWYKGRADDELVLQGINMLSRFPEAAEALRH